MKVGKAFKVLTQLTTTGDEVPDQSETQSLGWKTLQVRKGLPQELSHHIFLRGEG